jgi:hypothetical protein
MPLIVYCVFAFLPEASGGLARNKKNPSRKNGGIMMSGRDLACAGWLIQGYQLFKGLGAVLHRLTISNFVSYKRLVKEQLLNHDPLITNSKPDYKVLLILTAIVDQDHEKSFANSTDI